MPDELNFRKQFILTRNKIAHAIELPDSETGILHLSLIDACLESCKYSSNPEYLFFSSFGGIRIFPLKAGKLIDDLLRGALEFKDNPSVIASLLELRPQHEITPGIEQKYGSRHDERRKSGSYYTPLKSAQFMARILVDNYLSPDFKPDSDFAILDPASGAGVFLDTIYSELRKRNISPAAIASSLYAVDRDQDALDLTQKVISIKSGLDNIPNDHFCNADFLLDDSGNHIRKYDLIIGNPPYISYYSRESQVDTSEYKSKLKNRYGKTAGGSLNTFLHFIIRGIELLKDGGVLCFIIPDKLLWNRRYEVTRDYILNNASPMMIIKAGENVFKGATVGSVIILLKKGRESESDCIYCSIIESETAYAIDGKSSFQIKPSDFKNDKSIRFIIPDPILVKIKKNSVPLSQIAHIRDGINTGYAEFRNDAVKTSRTGRRCKPLIEGMDIHPFSLKPRTLFINYIPDDVSREMQSRGISFREEWIFNSPLKLVNRQTSARLIFAPDNRKHYSLNSVHNTLIKSEFIDNPFIFSRIPGKITPGEIEKILIFYLLGIMNSRLMNFYYQSMTQETSINFPQVHIADLEELPIRLADLDQIRKIAEIAMTICDDPENSRSQIINLDEMVFDTYGISKKERERITKLTGPEWRIPSKISHTR